MDIINDVINSIKEKLDKEYFYNEKIFLQNILDKLLLYKKEFEDDCK